MQKLKNNEARPKFTDSYKKKSVYSRINHNRQNGGRRSESVGEESEFKGVQLE